MDINYETISEIYGTDILSNLHTEYDVTNFVKNIRYLQEKNIECIDEIVSSYFPLFIYENTLFKKNVDNLLNRLGKDYIDIIAEDMDVLAELL